MLKHFHLRYKRRCLAVAILWIVGLFLMFAVTGHDFIGLALVGIGALLLFFPLCRLLEQKCKVAFWLRRAVTLILVICVGYFCVVESFILSDAHTETHETADYIIVLGAGVNGTKPSLSLRDRLEGAYDYMTANPNTIAIVSGGQGEGELISEAACMHDWLVEKGINPNRIIMEEQATCTLENLQYSMDIINKLSIQDPVIGVVSSEYHLHRAKRLAEYVGIDVIGVAAKTGFPTVAVNYFIREAFAMTEQYVFGYEGV
jgi:uncharacterized SAM-binding protein YcdF (DUF218 family)